MVVDRDCLNRFVAFPNENANTEATERKRERERERERERGITR